MSKICKECGKEFDPSSWEEYAVEKKFFIPIWVVWKYGNYCPYCKAGIYSEKYFWLNWFIIAITAVILIVIATIMIIIGQHRLQV